MEAVDRPALVLASENDPFIPRTSVAKWTHSDAVTIELTRSGGHVGFVGPARGSGFFWAAERILAFASSVAAES
jgi:predicted alpha/beta-fold hydrolase